MQLRINLKGITKPIPRYKYKQQELIDKKLLKYVAIQGYKAIRRRIQQIPWKRSTGKMRRSIRYKIGPKSATWYSDLHYTKYQNEGVRSHQMDYLLKAKSPIPLELPNGKMMFRWATKESMAKGGWQHPGYPGKKFFQYGRERARKLAQEKLSNSRRDFIKKLRRYW